MATRSQMPQPSKGKAPERGAPASAPAPFPFDEALNDLMQVVAGKTCPNRHSEMRVGTRPHRSPSPSIDFDPQQLPLDSPLDAQLLPRSGSHYGVVDSTTLTHIASALSRTRREAARRDACTLARTECRECLRGSERMGRRDQKEVPQRQCRHHRKPASWTEPSLALLLCGTSSVPLLEKPANLGRAEGIRENGGTCSGGCSNVTMPVPVKSKAPPSAGELARALGGTSERVLG